MTEEIDSKPGEDSTDKPANQSDSGLKEKLREVWFGYKIEPSADYDYQPSPTAVKTEKDINEIQLQKYKSHYERYQFYMEISLKAIVFYYVVTGAILSFYIENSENPYTKLSVLLPIALGFVWSGIFLYGARLWWKARRRILGLEKHLIAQKLIVPPPDFHLLLWLLIVFGILFFLVAVSIIVVWRRM